MNLPFQHTRRFITEFSVIRTMDYGDGGPDYQVHVGVTYGGCAPQLYGPPENCYPGEAAEWEIVGIDEEVWNDERKAYDYVPITDKTHTKEEIDAIEHWAEMLELSDDVEEALRDEHEAALEWRAEQRRDALE